MASEPVFFQDPGVLFRGSRAFDIAPFSGGSYAAQINSSARFMVYVITCVLAYAIDPFLLGLVACAGVYLYVRHQQTVPHGLSEEGEPSVTIAPVCQRPTMENPMGNFLINEYEERPDRPPGCDPEHVKDEIDAQFYQGLYRDQTDIYENANSQRQFYRTPVTTACNDQRAFGEFCFGEELGMNLNGAPAAPPGAPQAAPQGGPVPMNNAACAPDEVEFPIGGGTELDQLYRSEDPRAAHVPAAQIPSTYRDLPIHPVMQQALWEAHSNKEPVLTDEQRTALLVMALSIAVGSPYVQGRLREFLPQWLVPPAEATTWPRALMQGSLVASTFFLLRRYLLKKQG
ncbi:hypothetical protein KFL_007120080 [Klebsormidium nitens]|uniref:Minor capsid protein P9 transmembrane helices domain-containing protein n=1 Tax=Klebsormidium nitens TaxID=105231 RepID=A0A1Y1IJV1_KLENI|nr:hypothetical protein KFL_007120080 [Klebsormidium nitens]|eukprot:GAQ91003.1 hypothetical protein KFL_007120080 [Klebsormidium nitens]